MNLSFLRQFKNSIFYSHIWGRLYTHSLKNLSIYFIYFVSSNWVIINQQKDNEDPEDGQEAIHHPRLRQTIQWGHPVDNILGSLRKGVTKSAIKP